MQHVLEYLHLTHWQDWFLPSLGPVFLTFFVLEWRWMIKHQHSALLSFTWSRSITNFSLGATYLGLEIFYKGLIIIPVCLWLYQFRLWTIPVDLLNCVPIFIATEFCYYWFHRASHRTRWFWSAHVVHHSDEAMNLSTALRQSILYSVVGWWLFFTPLMLLGVHPVWVFFFYALDLFYQFFIHTEAVGRLSPWAEYIFDTPSNHRVHHGRNPQYIDKNYGGVIILFDRWFGTYAEEKEAVDFGIVHPIHSNNLLTLNLHEFVNMWRDALRPGPWSMRLKVFWAPPEWRRP